MKSPHVNDLQALHDMVRWSKENLAEAKTEKEKTKAEDNLSLYSFLLQEKLDYDAWRAKQEKEAKKVKPENMQVAGAYITHKNRVDQTEQKIQKVIRQLQIADKKISKAGVAKVVNLSREQISRRYSHLFTDEIHRKLEWWEKL